MLHGFYLSMNGFVGNILTIDKALRNASNEWNGCKSTDQTYAS